MRECHQRDERKNTALSSTGLVACSARVKATHVIHSLFILGRGDKKQSPRPGNAVVQWHVVLLSKILPG
jgi:hypothetical protein